MMTFAIQIDWYRLLMLINFPILEILKLVGENYILHTNGDYLAIISMVGRIILCDSTRLSLTQKKEIHHLTQFYPRKAISISGSRPSYIRFFPLSLSLSFSFDTFFCDHFPIFFYPFHVLCAGTTLNERERGHATATQQRERKTTKKTAKKTKQKSPRSLQGRQQQQQQRHQDKVAPGRQLRQFIRTEPI